MKKTFKVADKLTLLVLLPAEFVKLREVHSFGKRMRETRD